MTKYNITPYFGHDCNSWDGFNNGHYLDPITVNAETEEDAIDKAVQYAIEHGLAPMDKMPYYFRDNSLYWETYYHDEEGNEVTKEEFDALNEEAEQGGYLYQYLDFSQIKEVKP